MPSDCISYQDSGYFIPLIVDYLNQKPALQDLYHRFPTVENFEKQFSEKQSKFSDHSRKVLVSALQKQYAATSKSEATNQNINYLLEKNILILSFVIAVSSLYDIIYDDCFECILDDALRISRVFANVDISCNTEREVGLL